MPDIENDGTPTLIEGLSCMMMLNGRKSSRALCHSGTQEGRSRDLDVASTEHKIFRGDLNCIALCVNSAVAVSRRVSSKFRE